jgi:hypothetical protein
VALLLATVWALLLLCAFLYLGILEQRFGVDILADGGVYDQLFMLRGVGRLAAAAQDQLAQIGTQEVWRTCEAATRSAVELGWDSVLRASEVIQEWLR